MKIEKLPVDQLVQLKPIFNFTYGGTPEVLFESIKKIGVTHPPCVQEEEKGHVEILISGKRRIQTLFELDRNQLLTVHVFSPNELSKLEAFHLNLFENIGIRSLNPIEKSNVLTFLTQDLKISIESVLKNYVFYLGLPVKEETIHEYVKLQDLDEKAKELVALGTLQVDSAVQLLKFNKADASIILKLIQNLHLGVNTQKMLIKLSWEIQKKTGVSFFALSQQEAFKEILRQESWTPSQKWTRLESELKKLRYPMLSELENQFKHLKKEMKLPPSVTLQNPAYFEASDYLLQFRFKNLQEFHEHLKTLSGVSSSESLKQLFKLTEEDV
jgi:hypothetical protein